MIYDRLLVCGGRYYQDWGRVCQELDEFAPRPLVIIHGAARGADTLARLWAEARGVPYHPFPADWDRHGRAAGAIRNQQMLDVGRPTAVIAFPGGVGTADMVRRALKYGIPVESILDKRSV